MQITNLLTAQDTQDMVLAIMDADSTPCTGPGVEGTSQEEDSGCESFPTNVQGSLYNYMYRSSMHMYIYSMYNAHIGGEREGERNPKGA